MKHTYLYNLIYIILFISRIHKENSSAMSLNKQLRTKLLTKNGIEDLKNVFHIF